MAVDGYNALMARHQKGQGVVLEEWTQEEVVYWTMREWICDKCSHGQSHPFYYIIIANQILCGWCFVNEYEWFEDGESAALQRSLPRIERGGGTAYLYKARKSDAKSS